MDKIKKLVIYSIKVKQTYNKHIIRNLLEAIAIKNVVHRKGKTYENIICWDVVGSPGRGMIQQYVPALKKNIHLQ